ncbi:unnamed protein product, partial [Brenthis ino]
MPILQAPNVELGSAPRTPSLILSPSPSEISSASSPEPQNIRATPLFRVLAMPPPEPQQPPGQDELERRLPGYRRIVIPRELTLIELLSLSVNRCGLTSLDGVWGLGALRELHAAGNRLRDLHPLAALQKLHTLNLADNPIEESSRIWTLGVCSSLRRLTLSGTPIADTINYRSSVVSALPMLVALDERPLNDKTDEWIEEFLSDVDSNSSDIETDKHSLPISGNKSQEEPQPGPSKLSQNIQNKDELNAIFKKPSRLTRHRPATTECAGSRPRCDLPKRPRTALDRAIDAPTRLQIMNTLLDDEWRCSGSKLTSQGAVCGNLARALRKHKKENLYSSKTELEMVEKTMDDACRALAAEIPRAPVAADWERFKRDTGIEIDIDLNERPKEADPSEVIERLERIEKETMERLNNDNYNESSNINTFSSDPSRIFSRGITSDYDLWKEIEDLALDDPPDNVNDLFRNIAPIRSRRRQMEDESV